MNTEELEQIKAGLKKLIAQARAERKFIYSHYQQMWISPDELERYNAEGRFLWGVVNFELRDPHEYIAEMVAKSDGILYGIERFKEEIRKAGYYDQ